MSELILELEGLNCASCASKIENISSKLEGVDQANIDFVSKKLKVVLKDDNSSEQVKSEIVALVKRLEPGVVVSEYRPKKKVKRASIERASKSTYGEQKDSDKLELELEGLNCASCASKIEKISAELEGVEEASLDFVSKKLKVKLIKGNSPEKIKAEIVDIVNHLEPGVLVIDKKAERKKERLARENEACCSSHEDGHSHDHSHSHERVKDGHGHDHSGQLKHKDIYRIILSAGFFLLAQLLKLEGLSRLIIYSISYLIIGYPIIIQAFRNVRAGMAFDEYFLMTIATFGAFAIKEYPEAVAVMLFYQVGEYFQGLAVNKSRDSITSLMDIRPDSANLEVNGEIILVDPDDVEVGDIIVVKPGEKIALDGKVIEGSSFIDTSNITGESVPREVKLGGEVLSGTVNKEGLLRVEVSKEFGESTVSKILDLVENASSKKAATENFITKFARYYTPLVVFVALGLAIIAPLILSQPFSDWIYRACVFLVISCPCALVISVPLGFFGGIGGAAKEGILIKGGNYLEALNQVDTVVFDKTGTITKGTFDVRKIVSHSNYSEEEILEMAAYGEFYSNHPIGKSIMKEYRKEVNKSLIEDYEEISGQGIRLKINEEELLVGNAKLLESRNIPSIALDSIGTVVYIAYGANHVGTIEVADEIKENISEDLKKLKAMGIKETIMLSGDNEELASKVGEIVGLDLVYGNLLPQDKVAKLEEIIDRKKSGKVVFVGDGVNDAPVLARSDIGIAMGGLGSDAAIEASDIVIMTDEISKIPMAIAIAKKTNSIVKQNIIFALLVKVIVLSLGAFGVATMWEAVFADVGVSILAILNSIRALKVEK